MKVSIYNLNTDGSIPSYVINGGYFAKANNLAAPQDFDFVGILTDEATGQSFELSELIAYVESFMPSITNTITEETQFAAEFVTNWWQANVEA